MDRPEQRFPANTRVRLREGVDPGFYNGLSRLGNEGWVRRRKLDKYGYPQILVEWDKDHWAYNGQEDCWTWEGHFEQVEDNMDLQGEPDEQKPNGDDEFQALVTSITEKFVKNIYGAIADHRGETLEKPEPEAEEPNEESWQRLAGQATEAIDNAPAYIVIALEKLNPEGAPAMIVPRVFHAAREPEYALIAQSQLVRVLAAFQDEMISRTLQQRESDGEQ